MATGYAISGADYVRRLLPLPLEVTFTVGEETRADPYTATGTWFRFGGFDPGTHDLILTPDGWSQVEWWSFPIYPVLLDACRRMVRYTRYVGFSADPDRRLMELSYDNPDDIGGNPDGAGPNTYSTAWEEIPLHRADVTDEISGDDALAVLLASL